MPVSTQQLLCRAKREEQTLTAQNGNGCENLRRKNIECRLGVWGSLSLTLSRERLRIAAKHDALSKPRLSNPHQ